MKLINVVLSGLLLFSMNTYADDEKTIDVNFKDLKVRDFIEMVSKATKKNMLIETELKGKINFISQTPIKKTALISLANSILYSKGLTLVDKGDYYKVVKTNDAAGEGLPVKNTIDGEMMATVMFPLHNANAAVVRAKIKPLLHKNAKVISFKENNVLAITAYPSTLESIAKIIHAVEERGEKSSVILELEYSTVKDIFTNAQNMAKKLFPQTIESEKVDIFKDESTNSIIFVGKTKNIERMISYIKELDREGEDQSQKMYVIRLENSDVEEMEKILSKLLSQMNSVAIKTSKKGGPPPSKAMVVSDLERNALILLATGEQIKNIRETVAKIDIPKSQVYIQAKIIEVDSNMAAQIGMKYGLEFGAITSTGLFSTAGNLGGSALQMSQELLGFLNTNQSSTVLDSNGNAIQQSNPAFKIDSTNKVFALGAQLDLLKRNGAANLLSEPSILCTNNKESSIYVGQTMSILTQGQQSTAGLSNIVNNYSREDIGLTLTVTPRLSSNNQVSLEIEVKVEDLDPSSEQVADRPTTTKRTVKTNAIIKNAETIILGGLIKRVGGLGQTKIPFLSELPLLGDSLFTHNSDVEREQNVIIYLTPYIVKKSADLQKLKRILSELSAVQDRYNAIVAKNLDDLGKRPFKAEHDARGRIRQSVEETTALVQREEAKVRDSEMREVYEVPSSRGRISSMPHDAVVTKRVDASKSSRTIRQAHEALLAGEEE
ncbi:General secretion pathway protein D / Type II secretion outermembrane pore forming protein (PulD) [hydrothermal vent metagenome]|uniref:General secretion pathway protein D / Type II secretion outermembrane pore forming protein (PulD) n=1 Tax=hydrothermal vent metagenome TaxID=652676 RepID=A0A1W1CZS7_9ZZZZ